MKTLAAAMLLLAAAQVPGYPADILPPRGAGPAHRVAIEGTLEVKQATQDDEAVLAGTWYVEDSYDRPPEFSPLMFITTYRDSLFAAGWRIIGVTKIDETAPQQEHVVAAHYFKNGRNVYARLMLEPDGGPIHIGVADVGAENWSTMLRKDCRIRIPSLHFDLDRPTLREYESAPTLEKLADLLKSKSAPAVEIQGHMDNIGEAGVASRQMLSEGRAKIVASWLVAHGVPAAKITSKGYGKTKPIAENDSDLGRALNRRIEVARRDCTR